MEEFWLLIFVSFFATNSLDKAESVKVKLEETPLKTFDETFGEGWWDKDKTVAKELGLSFVTIYNWKRELGQTTPKHKMLKIGLWLLLLGKNKVA
uniref:Uncharacterized protein n=1 Tax=Globodera rostochiensis TaxID=31243 RepID=A0A914HTW2_GLORO